MSERPRLTPTRAGEPVRARERARVRDIVATSLLVTAFAAIVAGAVALTGNARWSVAFVITRWLLVGALLLTPLAQQLLRRIGARIRLPLTLQTPATALLLTCESIAFDIVSAHVHGA